MSIYIPGMEMPKGCFYCIFNKHLDPDTDMCRLTRDAFDSTFRVVEHRRDNCPLVPVPDHGRLGDLDALYKQFYAEELTMDKPYIDYLGLVVEAPTIIPADKEGEG